MRPIRVLSPQVANRVAAGEVVERPASVVKELAENAIDAGAKHVVIETENGGMDLIRVTDDGSGIPAGECRTAFLRHATSKLSTVEDFTHILTMGFRGEALASIASVSETVLKTKTEEETAGTRIVVRNGTVIEEGPAACKKGACFEVRDLFADVPARKKFLKSQRTEAAYVTETVGRLILGNPDVAFRYVSGERTVFESMGDGSLKNAILAVYGTELNGQLLPLSFDDGYLRIDGFIGTPDAARPTRGRQSFFINNRSFRSQALSLAVQRAYDTRLMVGKYPFVAAHLRIAGTEVDVNVHPTKMEVRFADDQRVVRSMTAACARALLSGGCQEAAGEENGFTGPAFTGTELQETGRTAASFGSSTQSGAFRGSWRSSSSGSFGGGWRDSVPQWKLRDSFAAAGAGEVPAGRELWQFNEDREEGGSPAAFDGLDAGADSFRVIGAAFNTYCIVEEDDKLLLIDQHAAHERLLYEAYMVDGEAILSQELLIGEELTLTPEEQEALDRYGKELRETGYSYTAGEDGAVTLTAVPIFRERPLGRDFFLEALKTLREGKPVSDRELVRERIIRSACRHAVKGGEALSREEIRELVETFRTKGIPMTCPHGRPVMIQMTKTELEKLFKRIL